MHSNTTSVLSAKCRKFVAAISVLAMTIPGPKTYAQDGHYWSENYGNRSMLLSGTVNASVMDLGAVFYNPGRLGLIQNPAFAISAQVYEWRTLKIEDDDDEISLNKSHFGGAPSLAAGTFKIPFLKNHRFAYSFLTRQRNNADFFTRVEKEGDVVDGLPGKEVFNGKLYLNTDLKEEWTGITWVPPVTKCVSIGLSGFISTINKSNAIVLDMNALNEFGQAGHYSVDRRYSYSSYGFVWKLGLAAELKKLQLGLTITTPRINVIGKGTTLIEDYLVGVDTTGDGSINDGYIFNNQSDLQMRYKSPWAIGFGIGLPISKGIVHMSAEWYDHIPEYIMMKNDPFIGQSTGDVLQYKLVEKLEQVFNYGIGIEWHFSEKLSAYGSFATDYSAVPGTINRLSDFKDTVNNSIFQAHFYQFGGGVSVTTKIIEITFGTTYKGASNTFRTELDFPDEGDDKPDDFSISTLTFSSWRFILGFSFSFADKLAKNFEDD